VRRGTRARSRVESLPAPVRGWIEDENLALNGGQGCSVCENWFPLQSTVRVRAGSLKSATIGEACTSLLSWKAGGIEKFFAASETAIYDISPLNPSTAPTASWTQLTSGRWSSVQMVAPGGATYLVAVNGTDPAMYFDGTNWLPIVAVAVFQISYDAKTVSFVIGRTLTGGTSAATATIVGVVPATATTGKLYVTGISGTFQDNEALTGSTAGGTAVANGLATSASTITVTGVTTSTLSHIWVHGNRLWAVQTGTMKAWYWPVDSFGGAAVSFNLAGVFREGGSLLFGASWSSDSGAGFADRCVFVSDQGEVAVYNGFDPTYPEGWTLLGLYSIGRPVGVQPMKAGGDLLVATTDGIVPMSQIVTKDPAALSVAAISQPIEPAWRRVTRSNAENEPVQMLKWQRESMGIVGYPHRDGLEAHIVNLQTGAWAKWTGLDIQCLGLYNDLAYFGDADGFVYQVEGSGSDNGAIYVARLSVLPNHLGAPGSYKEVLQARATFRSLVPFAAKLSVATDYGRDFPTAPSAAVDDTSPAIWDVGEWDLSIWDDSPDSEQRVTATTRWRSIGRSGITASAQVQIACGGARKPDAELVVVDLLCARGGAVV
jgi:hypothetical protein